VWVRVVELIGADVGQGLECGVRDVHTEMFRAEFMCGSFVVYRLNINNLLFRGESEC